MKHQERLELAKAIAHRIKEKYGKDILFIGVFGSVRRNEDQEFSDLEMFACTKSNKKYPYVSFIFKGIVVQVEFLSKYKILKRIKNLDVSWPAEVGRYLDPLKIYGSDKVLQELRKTALKIKEEKFKETLYFAFLEMKEHFNRLRNDYKNNNLALVIEAAHWFSWDVNMILALLNRKYYLRNGIKRFIEAKKFKIKPVDYESLMQRLIEGKTVDEIFRAAQKLYNECEKLVSKRKIRIREILDFSKIRI